MASGLYDASYEHDACGVGMVADLHGRPDHGIVDKGLTVLERLAHRGASGAEVSTGDGAGILVQVPHRFLVGAAEAAGFSLPDGRHLRRRPGLPARASTTTRPRPRRSSRPWRPRRVWRCWAGARAGRHRRAGRDRAQRHAAMEQLFVVPAPDSAGGDDGADRRPDGARAPGLRAAQAGRARRRRPVLPVAVVAHARLQGHADLRAAAHLLHRPARTRSSSRAWPWCTRASRPTPSRAGRWPTRTATWPTTGRSTRWPATATGCGPARRSSPAPH